MSPVAVEKSFLEAGNLFNMADRGRIFDFLSKFLDNPANPGLSAERVTKSKANDLWAARVTQGIRAIYHHEGDTYTLLHVGEHKPAWDWAERRRVGRNARTGELQVIVAPEVIEESLAKAQALPSRPTQRPAPPLLEAHSDDYLLSIGFPADWLPTLRKIRTDEQLEKVASQLPEELTERLYRLGTGEIVTPPTPSPSGKYPGGSIDANRRYWAIQDVSEIEELRDKPIETWMRFLHPSQREIVEREWSGPVKVTGGAGTGKTVVAMHRARQLARQGKKVLLTSFVTTLCRNLDRSLKVLCTEEEKKRITVSNVDAVAVKALGKEAPPAGLAGDDDIRKLIESFAFYAGGAVDADFLASEWENVVAAQGIASWTEYRDAQRRGRGKPLTVVDRKKVWDVFQRVLSTAESTGKWPSHILLRKAEEAVRSGRVAKGWDAVIVDEVQDLSAPALRFLAAVAATGGGSLMVVGDGGQRIYRSPFSLKSVGIDVRGRSKVLKLNYRNTRQIQQAADLILAGKVDDLDDLPDDRKGTLSPLGGPVPVLKGLATQALHDEALVSEGRRLLGMGLAPREIAVFARTGDGARAVQQILQGARIACDALDKDTDLSAISGVNVGTMHRAKGLEFKAVVLAQVSADVLPSPGLLRKKKDPADRAAAMERERNLLYVALTRARDEAVVLWVGEPSPFLKPVIDQMEASSK
jgi:hypothetical protein